MSATPDPNCAQCTDIYFYAHVQFTSSGAPVTSSDGTVTIDLTGTGNFAGQSEQCSSLYLEDTGTTFGTGPYDMVGNHPTCITVYGPGAEWTALNEFTAQAQYVPASSATQASSSAVMPVDTSSNPYRLASPSDSHESEQTAPDAWQPVDN
jgi:hypothetical protein